MASLTISATNGAMSDVGVREYVVSRKRSEIGFTARGASEETILSVTLSGLKLASSITPQETLRVLRAPELYVRDEVLVANHELTVRVSGRLGNFELSGRSASRANRMREARELKGIAKELQKYGNDLAAHREELVDAEDAFCYVAGVGAGIWPAGTLLFGPSALICAIHYYDEGILG